MIGEVKKKAEINSVGEEQAKPAVSFSSFASFSS